jgi:hypothetical protein
MRVHYRIRRTAAMALAVGACLGVQGTATAQEGGVRADVGLSGPLPEISTVAEFGSALARQLLWELGSTRSQAPSLRLNVVRIDRGRVTASLQSRRVAGPEKQSRVRQSLGEKDWNTVFPECCLTPADLPIRIKAYSGRSHLDAEHLERAIARLAETAIINGIFDLRPPVDLDWGRHVVLIVSVASDAPLAVRPLILVLERR